MRPLEAGLSLRGYRLLSRLGIGGDGEVWLAQGPEGGEVALKARPRRGGVDEQRFREEFEKLRTLRLPHVVRVLDAEADQGYIFFTMDVAFGLPFDQAVAAAGGTEARVARACKAGAGVARALVGIHRLGLAHRDMKPANILVDERGKVTVLDFGTARFGASADSGEELQGTVAYMAPEQRVGLPHDRRVDIYALGVTLHEALSGEAATPARPGRPRRPLILVDRALPRALSELVDRMLRLDPAERPTAEQVYERLLSLANQEPQPPVPWPASPHYAGDPGPLLDGSAVVVGKRGSGRRRMVEEARWAWYRKGFRSIAGSCAPDRPFSALRELLAELFSERDPASRRELAGEEAPYLQALWNELPVPVSRVEAWPPDPIIAGRALASVLARRAPLALVLWDLDQADIGTTAVLQAMLEARPAGVLIWGTARRPVPGLRQVSPPPWSPAAEREVLRHLLPAGQWPEGEAGASPLRSMARAWAWLARWRGEKGPSLRPTVGMSDLSMLEEPFPMRVARRLTGELPSLLESGHLILRDPGTEAWGEEEGTENTSNEGTEPSQTSSFGPGWATPRLVFADPGTRLLAAAEIEHDRLLYQRVAEAWRSAEAEPERDQQLASASIRAGDRDVSAMRRAIRSELERGSPAQVDRWLCMHDLLCSEDEDFLLAFARLYSDLELRPGRIQEIDIERLGRRAEGAEQQGMANWLWTLHQARQGDRLQAIEDGSRWAGQIAGSQPMIASAILREVALARLSRSDLGEALRDCRTALSLAREATRSMGPLSRVSQTEINAGTTLSAALIYSGRWHEAAEFCEGMAERCRGVGNARGQGAMLANLAVVRIYLGRRDEAAEANARCRAAQAWHHDPVVHGVSVLTQARLAVEMGDLSTGRSLLDEAITTCEAVGLSRQLAEAWAWVLELAVHSADAPEARRAFQRYGQEGALSDQDPWPAVRARWLWLRGDLQGALQTVSEARVGHADLCVRAERCRLLLVAGHYDLAFSESQRLIETARAMEASEILTFAALVAGAANAVPQVDFEGLLRQTRSSRWVHLYLGALHLDAIRRQLRGEPVTATLRQLRARSRDLRHRLYEALAREDGW